MNPRELTPPPDLQADTTEIERSYKLNFRKPRNHLAHFSLGMDFARKAKDKKYAADHYFYQRALASLEEAIKIAMEDKNPRTTQYLLEQATLQTTLGMTPEAAKSLKLAAEASDMFGTEGLRPVQQMHLENLKRDVTQFVEMQNKFKQMVANGLSPELANQLIGMTDVLKEHDIFIRQEAEKNKDRDKDTELLKSRTDKLEEGQDGLIQDFTNFKAQVEEEFKLLRRDNFAAVEVLKQMSENRDQILSYRLEDLQKIVEKCKGTKSRIEKLEKESVRKGDLELYVYKVPEEISNDPLLNAHYGALFQKLSTDWQEAIAIRTGRLKVDNEKTLVTIVTTPFRLVPKLGPPIVSLVQNTFALFGEKNLKQKLVKLLQMESNPDDVQFILKTTAALITLDKADEIRNPTGETLAEIELWEHKDWVDKGKSLCKVDIDKEVYKGDNQKILGYINGEKVLKFVKAGELKENIEKLTAVEIITMLIGAPDKYRLEETVNLKAYVGKKYKKTDT